MPRAVSFPFQDAGIQTNGTLRGIRTVELKKHITIFSEFADADPELSAWAGDDGSSSALNFRNTVSDF